MTTDMQGKYNVSIRYAIDGTGSMAPIIDTVKGGLLAFPGQLTTALAAKGKVIGKLQVGIDVFRDVYCDGANAFVSSRFFDMATEQGELQKFVAALRPMGGGDEPENGLEGLTLALNATWPNDTAKQRHVVVVYTDASAHPLEKAAGTSQLHYPVNMPASFSELTDRWSSQSMDRNAKRLILFAPDAYPWTDIATNWENCVHYASRAGEGLSEVDAQTILDAVVNSIAV
jgi:hypothetical protein